MLDKNSPTPLYQQILKELKAQLKAGKYRPGQRMPSEAELMRAYGVSRMTVRLAIDGLEKQGYVTKVQGRGTFVRKRKIVQELSAISSWSENLRTQGLQVESRLLKKAEIAADEDAAEKLEVPAGTPLYYIERLKLVDGEPLGWGRIWVKKSQFPALIEQEEIVDSVYTVLEGRYGAELARATEVVEAMVATRELAARLSIAVGAPLLKVTRVTYDANDMPLEISRIISRADRYAYKMALAGRRGQKPR